MGIFIFFTLPFYTMGVGPSEPAATRFTLGGKGEHNATLYTLQSLNEKVYFSIPLWVEPHQQEALDVLIRQINLLKELNTPPHPRVYVPMHTHKNPFSETEETPLVEWWIKSTSTGEFVHDSTYKYARCKAFNLVEFAKCRWRDEVINPMKITTETVRINW